MDRQMKGEYFKMKNHGFAQNFQSASGIVHGLHTSAHDCVAEDTTGLTKTQPKTVVVDEGEKKTDPPRRSSLRTRIPLHRKSRKHSPLHTLTVQTAQYFPIRFTATCRPVPRPPLSAAPLLGEGYTFAGWNPAVAETVTANVTYVAQWEAGKTGARRVTLPTIPEPDITPAALNTGHKIDVRFTVLYVGSEFNIGYNYGSSEKTQFVCQYKTNHSDTAYNNHTIAISDIKAAASRASVNSGYQIRRLVERIQCQSHNVVA